MSNSPKKKSFTDLINSFGSDINVNTIKLVAVSLIVFIMVLAAIIAAITAENIGNLIVSPDEEISAVTLPSDFVSGVAVGTVSGADGAYIRSDKPAYGPITLQVSGLDSVGFNANFYDAEDALLLSADAYFTEDVLAYSTDGDVICEFYFDEAGISISLDADAELTEKITGFYIRDGSSTSRRQEVTVTRPANTQSDEIDANIREMPEVDSALKETLSESDYNVLNSVLNNGSTELSANTTDKNGNSCYVDNQTGGVVYDYILSSEGQRAVLIVTADIKIYAGISSYGVFSCYTNDSDYKISAPAYIANLAKALGQNITYK